MSADTRAQRVRDTIASVMHGIDGKRFAEVRALYAPRVEVDYTSLFGGEVQQLSADDLVAGWETRLSPIVTQHLLGPIVVSVSLGDEARAECHVMGTHWGGGRTWTVWGHYRFALREEGGAWRITQHVLETFGEAGDRSMLG
jgi:hypothetical protein